MNLVYQVHFLNYVETFNDFDLGKFDHAFIILDYDDIIADYAEKQIFNNYIKNKEFLGNYMIIFYSLNI